MRSSNAPYEPQIGENNNMVAAQSQMNEFHTHNTHKNAESSNEVKGNPDGYDYDSSMNRNNVDVGLKTLNNEVDADKIHGDAKSDHLMGMEDALKSETEALTLNDSLQNHQ